MARPSKYTPELLEKAQDYLDNWQDLGDVVPVLCGLYIHCGITRETASQWAKEEDKKPFSDICARVRELQERELLSKGLSRKTDNSLTKLMLMRHGYSEKSEVDHTTNGENITGLNVTFGEGS
jgi:hypothetical protein